MLSENSKMTRPDYLKALPEIERPITVRIKFIKVGDLQYISHLDLQRTFNRILVRSGLPVWYSKGFNPHVKLVFSTPLSVGSQSSCEYLDLRLDRELPMEEIKRLLNNEMTEEMYVTDVYLPTTSFSDIAFCEYDYEISTPTSSAELAEEIESFLTTSPVNLIKKTKAGEREIDIVSMIKSIKTEYSEESKTIKMNAVLSAGAENFLNPEMLITAIKQKFGILTEDLSTQWYSIMRVASLTKDMKIFR
ncbi:MAG: DUF2344 domain-containing protein [Clostridia bacterium]|nr:DUF2344 domain-containing protein [Clostridia bacterium]